MDSTSLRVSEGKMTLKLGGMERTPKIADGQVLGFNEKVVPAELECTALHTSQTDIEKVRNAKSVTLLIITDTGKKYTMREAFSIEPGEIKGGDGDYDLKFAGPPAIES
jgi:hypothetical protein